MKTLPDYYAEIFREFLDAIMRGSLSGTDSAVLAIQMLYEGRY